MCLTERRELWFWDPSEAGVVADVGVRWSAAGEMWILEQDPPRSVFHGT